MRKLSFIETIHLSKILSDIEIKSFVKDFKASLGDVNNVSMDTLNLSLSLDLISYIISNLHKCETSLKNLLESYSGKLIDEIDIDEITNILKTIWDNGLPTMVTKLFKLDTAEKKTEN